VLAGFDQKSNVVLSDCKERVYSTDEGVEEIPLGLYLVKGETMCVLLPPLIDISFISFIIAVSLAKLMRRPINLSTSQQYEQNLSHRFDMVDDGQFIAWVDVLLPKAG